MAGKIHYKFNRKRDCSSHLLGMYLLHFYFVLVSITMNEELDFDWSDEEDNLANHADELENGFDFVLTPHLDRRVRHLGVRHRNYTGRLVQHGGALDFNASIQRILPNQLEEAVRRSIEQQVLNDPGVKADDYLYVNLNSNRLHHGYHSPRMRV